MSDNRPIIGLNHKRGKRVEWEEFDRILKGAIVTFETVSRARDGLHETVIRCGRLTDGTAFRTREFYAI